MCFVGLLLFANRVVPQEPTGAEQDEVQAKIASLAAQLGDALRLGTGGTANLAFDPVGQDLAHVLGHQVATLMNERKAAGSYEIIFDAAGLANGLYFYRLQAGRFTQTRIMTLIK